MAKRSLRRSRRIVEPLENRIAPAAFFLSGADTSIRNVDGDVVGASILGADSSVLLKKGDQLYFDADGADAGMNKDSLLVQVTGGEAIVFATDRFDDGDAAFGVNEITGLAVSDGFIGKVFTDINGSVATILDAEGGIVGMLPSVELQKASIKGLTVTGRITGSIFSGNDIGNLSVGGGIYSEGQSVSSIATGTAASGSVFYFSEGAASPLQLGLNAYTPDAGADGGSITGLKLAKGAGAIGTGNGGAGTSEEPHGGAGGSLINATINEVAGDLLSIELGGGGVGFGPGGLGGAGGGVSKLIFTAPASSVSATGLEITTGTGGASAKAAAAGGSLVASKFSATLAGITIQTGDGGESVGAESVAGAGGSISGNTFFIQNTSGAFVLDAGAGGSSTGGKAGAGGSVAKNKITNPGAFRLHSFAMAAGNGGSSDVGAGGAGGAISGNTITQLGEIGTGISGEELFIGAGNGGASPILAGAGGAIAQNKMTFGIIDTDSAVIRGGEGGALAVGTEGVSGGAGGAVSQLALSIGGLLGSEMSIAGGGGGSGGGNDNVGAGGHGGALSKVTMKIAGAVVDSSIALSSGFGQFGGVDRAGGNGGVVSGVKIENAAEFISTADPGPSPVPLAADPIQVIAGGGGDSFGTGRAGNGGSISGLVVTDTTGESLALFAGAAGKANGAGAGGNGGNVSKVMAKLGYEGTVFMKAGDGGTSGGGFAGGAGGSLSNIQASNTGGISVIGIAQNFSGGNGGSNDSGTGSGGAGGSVTGLKTLNIPAYIVAGAGGQSGSAATADDHAFGGAGGGVSNLTLNYQAPHLGFAAVAGGSGGSTAAGAGVIGSGGAGGDVRNVTVNGAFLKGGAALQGGAGGNAGEAGGNGGDGGEAAQLRVKAGSVGVGLESFLKGGPGPGGAGGPVSPGSQPGIFVNGGIGGNAYHDGNGGDAGDISSLDIAVNDVQGVVQIGGDFSNGEQGAGTGVSGDGTSISKVNINVGAIGSIEPQDETAFARGLYILGTSGGSGGAQGGAGGTLSGITVNATLLEHDSIFAGGLGGEGTDVSGTGGGAGGGVVASVFNIKNSNGVVQILGGAGGNSASNTVHGVGGAGGGISGVKVSGANFGGIAMIAGDGGTHQDVGTGGAGGSISNSTVNLTGDLVFDEHSTNPFIGKIAIHAGDGGEAGLTSAGGAGGSLASLTATIGFADRADLSAGNGGNVQSGAGGAGGNVSKVTFTNRGQIVEESGISAGNGGNVTAEASAAGVGGSVSNVTYNNGGSFVSFAIGAGMGGGVPNGAGNAGDGGDLKTITVNNKGAGLIALYGGSGGSTGFAGDGGDAGVVDGVKLNSLLNAASFYLTPGSGGSATGTTQMVNGNAGNAGDLRNVFLNAPSSEVTIGLRFPSVPVQAGSSSKEGGGGDGGDVTKVSGTAGILRVVASSGGNSAEGAAGDGGSVSEITVKVTNFAQIVAAGNGGSTGSGTAGVGGDITAVKITGDIGNYSASFGFDDMGGLFAGQGGSVGAGPAVFNYARNGTISNVSASRIAAIMAGVPAADAITIENAVEADGIVAALIGADLNGNGRVDDDTNTVWGVMLPPAGIIDSSRLVDGIALILSSSDPLSSALGAAFVKTVIIPV